MNPRIFTAALVSLMLAGIVLAGTALAHSYLSNTSIPANSILKTMPERLTLEFSEPLEVGFSTFKVYKLETKTTDGAKIKLEAEALVARVLALKNDLAKRADNGLETTAGEASRVKMKLKESLTSGIYVVMYRVLSVDTHVTQDFYSFKIATD